MKSSFLRFALPAFCLFAAHLQGQQSSPPWHVQSLNLIKVTPGKNREFLQLMRDTSMKVAQQRVDKGEILVWTLLRSVMPAGQEARADYIISTISVGPPPVPMDGPTFEAALKKAGASVSLNDFYAARTSTSTLVASELWQLRERVASPKKGHYVMLNSMKVTDRDAYGEFESKMFRPMAEEIVKQGFMSGWLYSTKMLPTGSETPYTAMTVDMFPTWEAAFANFDFEGIFKKVHPGRSLDDTMVQMEKLRSIAKRELWVIEERIEKKK